MNEIRKSVYFDNEQISNFPYKVEIHYLSNSAFPLEVEVFYCNDLKKLKSFAKSVSLLASVTHAIIKDCSNDTKICGY